MLEAQYHVLLKRQAYKAKELYALDKILLEYEKLHKIKSDRPKIQSNWTINLSGEFEKINKKNPQKGKIFMKEAYLIEFFMIDSPLEMYFRTTKIENVRYFSEKRYTCIRKNYYINVSKEFVSDNRTSIKLFGLRKQREILTKKINTLKTEKGKKPYEEALVKVNRKLYLIEEFPEKLL